MEVKTMNASLLARMFLGAAANLDNQKEWINELNVFPVPDGDTGTNMTMTIMSAAKAVEELGSDPKMRDVCKAISSGSLRGARGNSGVILSQLFRGFTKIIRDCDEVNVQILCDAAQRACETAYKAVMKPKEGTILTVARGVADKALELADETEDIVAFMDGIIKEGDEVLARTPEMLPVLKQAGVVDSGGQGLMQVLKGAYIILTGGEIKAGAEEEKPKADYTYEVRFRVISKKLVTGDQVSSLRNYLQHDRDCEVQGNANSISVTAQCEDPGVVITEALKYGVIDDLVFMNLKADASQTQKADESTYADKVHETDGAPVEKKTPAVAPAEEKLPEKDMAFVAVSLGEGMNEVFRELGCDYIISGGQTMNPSTEDVLTAIEKANAKSVFVLPNNKNIIMAANQAAELCEDKNVIVIPTKTIPQGITALINFIPEQSAFDNEARMLEEIKLVKTGQITYAVRDTVIDDKQIHQGDYMGIGDKGILSVNKDMEATFMDMIGQMIDEDSSIVSIYFGDDVDEKDAEKFADEVRTKYSDLEVEVQNGGQPVYYYTVSVE